MFKIPLAVWITNAAARLAGAYGDITHQAQAADCSRQTVYDHAHKVQAAVAAEYSGGPTRAELLAQNQRLQQENPRLWDGLAQTIDFPVDAQRQFIVVAVAMGLSLNQVRALLALILGVKACPGRSTLHRWVKAAASGGLSPSVRRYAWHRVRRIMPAYLVTVIVAYVLYHFRTAGPNPGHTVMGFLRSSRKVEGPSIPGIITSRRMASGLYSAARTNP